MTLAPTQKIPHEIKYLVAVTKQTQTSNKVSITMSEEANHWKPQVGDIRGCVLFVSHIRPAFFLIFFFVHIDAQIGRFRNL